MFNERMVDVHFREQRRIRWCETDTAGFVHFANYLRYMEETEYAFLRSRGLKPTMRDAKGLIGFPRVATQLEIIMPVRFDDQVDVWLRFAGHNGVQIHYQFEISAGADIVATSRFAIACCRFVPNDPPRAILIPDFVVERLPSIVLSA